MATLYTEQSKNVWKTWLLMACFFAVLAAVGYFLSLRYGNPAFLTGFVILSIVMNIGSYWYSDKIVLSLSRAREISKTDYPEYWNIAENLSITAGLPMPRLYAIEDAAPNAFATGRDKKHAAVAVTTGLLSILNKSELEGVIAHELSHIGNRDILLATVVSVLVGCISLAADFTMRSSIFRSRDSEGRGNQLLTIVGIVFIILSPVVATIIQLAISRKREFLADASGALLTRYPEGLAEALRKISAYKRPLEHAHAATAHLFISNPLGGKEDRISSFAKLFMTHPPTEERIAALLGMKA